MRFNTAFVFVLAVLLTGCVSVPSKYIEWAKTEGIPIVISSIYPSYPNSAGGVDVHIDLINTSYRSLKYVVITVMPYNKVGDVAPSEIGRKTSARLRDIGPISPGHGNGSGYWQNVWYNHSIRCVEITGIEVTYINGNSKNISSDELYKAIAPSVRNYCGVQ